MNCPIDTLKYTQNRFWYNFNSSSILTLQEEV